MPLGDAHDVRFRLAALLMTLCAMSGARALAQDNPVQALLFGSADAGASSFFNAGAKFAIDDVNREGFVALVNAGGGIRSERGLSAPGSPAPTFVRTTMIAAALGGYQFFREWGVVAVFAGPEGAFETRRGDEAVPGTPARFGLRLQGELWARPSEQTLATATLVLGSARWDLYGRVSAGYRFWGAYLGPEALGYGDRTGYRKFGLGLHATDFAFSGISFRVSAGALYEPEIDRLGPYVALAAWTPL